MAIIATIEVFLRHLHDVVNRGVVEEHCQSMYEENDKGVYFTAQFYDFYRIN